jgi:hypothetical protein
MTLYRKIFSFATVTLLVALSLSAVAAWYSILGLTAIFAAAVIPIMIMGGSLELAKVVTTVWLHRYWNRCGLGMKLYLIPAVVALALLTSMGIFGFLSKAHTDQTLISGDVGSRIVVYDEKISTARENIETSRRALQQMDAQVDQLLGRTTDDKGANRAVQVRRQQRAERTRLQNEIAAEQEIISKLNEESAPIRAEIRKIEAEVGPIKYIAAMIYGDNPDTNLLERAVRWVIVLIVLVFDPLALMLMLAAQSGYRWQEEDDKKEEENKVESKNEPDTKPVDVESKNEPEIRPVDVESKNEPDTKPVDVEEIEDHISDTIILHDEVAQVDTDRITCDTDETEPGEAEPAEKVEIQTEGVTLHEIQEGYYDIEGKSMSKAALLGMRPELFSARPDTEPSNTNFGTEFPRFAKKSDIFVRVDVLPNKVFKFDGYKWIEINKENSDSYLYDEAYIRHLVSKIASGEYDIDLLSENEKVQIEEYLQRNQSQDK